MNVADLATLHAKAFSATRAWSGSEFASLLAQPGTFHTGDAKCFALIRVVADEAEILTLATDPAVRRQGRARAVLRAAIAEATTRNAGKMFLEVAEDNTPAIALYAEAGFVRVGRRPGYYVPKNAAPVAALIMQRALKSS